MATNAMDIDRNIKELTLKRWLNNLLAPIGVLVSDLESYFSDGTGFLTLLEVLEKNIYENMDYLVISKPQFRYQHLENVNECFRYCKANGVEIGKLSSKDIVDGKLEKILELLSSFMLHYFIKKPVWVDERMRTDMIAKDKLLTWIQNKIPEKGIRNFTSDWNDGTAIGALVDTLVPGACKGWKKWNPQDSVYNATQAMAAAYKWTGIPQLIDPCDMCSPALDEISTMTYLSQFPNRKPIIFPAMVNVHGPGIEPFCNTIGNPARFVVETKTAGEGEPDVFVTDPDGKGVHCERKSSNCVFVPLKTGIHQIKVLFAGIETPRSPYLVNVDQMPGHAENVTATGPGLEKLDDVLKKNHFEVLTKNAGIGVVDVGIIDARGLFLESHVTRVSQDVWQVEYSHKVKGRHSIYIFYAGKAIPNSPFHVGEVKMIPYCVDYQEMFPPTPYAIGYLDRVVEIPHSRSCSPLDAARLSIASQIPSSRVRRVEVKGLNDRFPTEREVEFDILVDGKALGLAKVLVLRPSGKAIVAKLERKINVGFTVKFTPIEVGPHQIQVVYAGHVVQQSPLQCEAYTDHVPDMRLIICFGPGLHPDGVFLGSNIDFQVNTKNIRPVGQGEVRASITSPSGRRTQVSTIDNKDGTFNCSCKPEEEGPHVIYVVYGGLPVPKSPFRVNVRAGCDPSKVKAYGPGLEMALLHEPQFFIVETKGAGRGEIAVEIDGPAKVAVQYEDDGDGRIIVRYKPTMIGGYDIIIKFAERQIQGNPFKVYVARNVNLEKVMCYGPGIKVNAVGDVIEPISVRASYPTYFFINVREAGIANLDVIIKDPTYNPVKHSILSRHAGVYEVSYTPERMGIYQLLVQFRGQDVPNTPITIYVAPTGDARKVKILGKVSNVSRVGSKSVINLNAADAGSGFVTCSVQAGYGDVGCNIKYPSVRSTVVSYTPISAGPHAINLMFGGQPIPGGQFMQNAM